MTAAELETPRPATGPGFADAVTFAFGDLENELYGLARLGLVPGEPATAGGLAVLFRGREPVGARAEGGVPVAAEGWAASAGGVRTEVLEPLRAWRVAGEGEGYGFSLTFTATSAPLPFELDGGQEGYEQLCAVEGEVEIGGSWRAIACPGQRGHAWGAPDWDRLGSARSVCAWWPGGRAVVLQSLRPAKAKGHGEDPVVGYLLEGDVEAAAGGGLAAAPPGGALPAPPARLDDPRLSTTYDAEGRQRRAGLELWETADAAYARRASGEVVCGTTLELGRLTLDTSFFRWSMEGCSGVGRYEILRRTADGRGGGASR